jgi:hypothetical protein
VQEVVHHGLESGRRVCEAEKHHQRLIQTPIGPKSGLPLISIAHPDVVVAPAEVQFGIEPV